ncbi:MAG TPA: caspase family protein [Actinomycetota bacterium]|nr:caspase family protein [Actinomycetota bacterium]
MTTGEGIVRRLLVLLVGSLLLAGIAVPVSAAPAHVQDKWALIIGVDTHTGRTRDNIGAVGDAVAFQDLLRSQGWPDDHVRVLTNQQATQAGIRQGMQWLVDRCQSPDSYCVFHFSGHTKQMNNAGGSEGLHEYLWPSDNRFISDDEFAGYMRRLNGYAWIDLANCESAGFDNGISSPKRLVTGASQEHEKGFEYPSWRNSVWIGSLVEHGMLGKAADSDGDGHVTLREALPYAAAESAALTSGQSPSPQHPYIAGGEEGNWFPPPAEVSRATSAPAPPPRVCILLILCNR